MNSTGLPILGPVYFKEAQRAKMLREAGRGEGGDRELSPRLQCGVAAFQPGLPGAARVQEVLNHKPAGRSHFQELNGPEKTDRSNPYTGVACMETRGTIKPIRRASLPVAALLFAALFAAPAPTYADSGFYVGGSIGRSLLDAKISDPGAGSLDFDDGDSAWKGFAGFNIDAFVIDLAIEGGYVDFGQPADRIAGNDVEFDLSGWDVFGLAGVELGPVGVFGKAGFIDWSADASLNGARVASDSGTDPAYGIGVRFSLFSAELRGEYEYFDIEDADASLLSVGVVWTF